MKYIIYFNLSRFVLKYGFDKLIILKFLDLQSQEKGKKTKMIVIETPKKMNLVKSRLVEIQTVSLNSNTYNRILHSNSPFKDKLRCKQLTCQVRISSKEEAMIVEVVEKRAFSHVASHPDVGGEGFECLVEEARTLELTMALQDLNQHSQHHRLQIRRKMQLTQALRRRKDPSLQVYFGGQNLDELNDFPTNPPSALQGN